MRIDKDGLVQDPRVRIARSAHMERGAMHQVRGIIVHQTDSDAASATLNSYRNTGAAGAHFLIDRDGTTYQTASVYQGTWHVGRLKARCMAEHRCTPVEVAALKKFSPRGENEREMKKSVPERYPSNQDSIGIEIVGLALPRGPAVPDERKTYEAVSDAQNASLKWLVAALSSALGVSMTEVFRHPTVSRKNQTEAATARWQ
jgi:N-acetyl-anhydromuramyl-L-alanine amidase AmpD